MDKKMSPVGLRQAYQMNQMSYHKRIDFIAEGLPLILKNAQKLYADAQLLSNSPTSAAILINCAKEEAAKILILMDIVRCPKKRVSRDIGHLIKRFYSHAARLIYAESVSMRPIFVSDLKRYIRYYRTHHLDGRNGEYITPNASLFEREIRLYVDVAVLGSDKPEWVSPLLDNCIPCSNKPCALTLAEDLETLGLFESRNLQLIGRLWGGGRRICR